MSAFRSRVAFALARIVAVALLASVTLPAASAEEEQDEKPPYTRQGADSCIRCHDKDAEYPVFDIFKTAHANVGDERTPFAKLQCESCHGPGGEHGGRVRRGQERPPIRNFGPDAETPVAEQNAVCLDCHKGHERIAWQGSVHSQAGVSCASCHKVHAAHDPVLAESEEPDVCVDCHAEQRADIHKAFVHPVRYGEMACSSCHQPHGAHGPAALEAQTVNRNCYECHAEKRGPFLWEHAPVAEDCTNCHQPHGSNHPSLLTKRPPLLCQQCHSQRGHPSISHTGRGLAGSDQPSRFLLGRSCMNCHSQVHGSNHPSGAALTR